MPFKYRDPNLLQVYPATYLFSYAYCWRGRVYLLFSRFREGSAL